MEGTFTIPGLLCLLLVAASAADLRNNDELYNRLERLEQRYATDMANYASDIASLLAENDINKAEIASLKAQVAECKQWNNDRNENGETSNVVGESGDVEHGETSQRQMTDDEPRVVTSDRDANHQKYLSNNRKRALVEGTSIAFTAYLDHDLHNQGTEQLLMFNKVLLNHGNAYNNVSGMFTAPMAGVYSFIFFVGQRDHNQYAASLVVNNQHMVDAITDPFHTYQELQGGNSANLMLSQGDVVFVRHATDTGGTQVEGSDGLRLSTFSGFLIYPVDERTSVVG